MEHSGEPFVGGQPQGQHPIEMRRPGPDAIKLALLPFAKTSISWKPVGVKQDSDYMNPCPICGKDHKHAREHLSFVSHSVVTKRLLELDPNWSWRPMSFDAQGRPAFVFHIEAAFPVALWGWFKLFGKEIPAVGSIDPPFQKDGEWLWQGRPLDYGNAMKSLIGDLIRNGAMRFGVGLHLWIDGERVTTPFPDSYDQYRTNGGTAAPAKPPERANFRTPGPSNALHLLSPRQNPQDKPAIPFKCGDCGTVHQKEDRENGTFLYQSKKDTPIAMSGDWILRCGECDGFRALGKIQNRAEEEQVESAMSSPFVPTDSEPPPLTDDDLPF